MLGRPLPKDVLERLLVRTSRTFALAIPLLEEPLASQVGLAYLLFRIADTLEDAPLWGRERRTQALASFARWVDVMANAAAPDEAPEWLSLVRDEAPTRDEGCLELLERAGDVIASTRTTTSAEAFRSILIHTQRTALGMADFVRRQDDRGGIVLSDIDDLKRYAYAVAGIVGEMLTELFALGDEHVARVRAALDADAIAFGEGLQLVNILKDASSDACEGRSYLPPGVPRTVIVDLARSDLARASRYVRTLVDARAPRGVIAFCDLPIHLAQATLDRLEQGAAKLDRHEVMTIFASVTSR